jgi:hypothetical protein
MKSASHWLVVTLVAALTACTSPVRPEDAAGDTVADVARDVTDGGFMQDVPNDVADTAADVSPHDVDAGPDVTCSLGLEPCGVDCVDLQTSETHCGMCGRSCMGTDQCINGACAPRCDPMAGEMRCGTSCVNTTVDPMHCGACNQTCGALERCEFSSCVSNCPVAGQIACGATCVDTRTDNNNCGGCGRVCGVGQRCMTGMCANICSAGQTFCSGTCANLQTSITNCGMCGRACPMGQMCNMGVCAITCTLPTMACGGMCVDTTTNVANCGMCGRACTAAPNATPACAASTCGLACTAGFGNCDAMATTGCETDVRTSLTHCGACGRACTAAANQTATCAAGACALRCTAGFGDCDAMAANGCETNVTTSTSHCGMCGRACVAPAGGSVTCAAGACVPACLMGETICGATMTSAGRCANLQTDRTNCGTCGTVCPGTQSCVAGRCMMLCPMGQTACGAAMTCVDTTIDRTNCGACGRACAATQTCVLGACLSNFQVTSMTTAACTASSVAEELDQRGAIAAGNAAVVTVGDGLSVRSNSTTGTGPVAITALMDGLVTDLATNTAYVLGSASGPLRANTGLVAIDRLFRVDPIRMGWIPSAPLMLSAPISVNTSTGATSPIGVYNGSGRIVLHSGSRVFEILVPSGMVVDRGALLQFPRTLSESWATWGVVQIDAGRLYLTYVQSNSTIARIRVSDSQVETVATFTDIGDTSGFLVVPSLNRWFFSFEGVSQVGGVGAVNEFIASCPATFVTTAGDFRITSLSAVPATCTVIDVTAVIGDDRGAMAVQGARLALTGDTATASVGTSPFVATDVRRAGPPADHIFSDLATGQLWGLYVGAVPLYGGSGMQTVDRIIPLSEISLEPSAAAVTLSAPIAINTSAPASTMMFSGSGRALIATNGRATNVELPSGVVRDFGPIVLPAHANSDSWAAWGVVETVVPATRIVFIENAMRVSRFTLGGVTIAPVATFTNLGTTGSFAFSALRSRWFVQSKGSNQYLGLMPPGEYLLSCPATSSIL